MIMKTKNIIAVLATTVAGIFLGWLIFGEILRGFYSIHTTAQQGMIKSPPEFWTFIVGNLGLSILLVYVFLGFGNIKNFVHGFISGGILLFLIAFSVDILFYGTLNLFDSSLLIVDIVANTILGGIMGSIAGWVLGMEKKPREVSAS